MFFSCLYTPVLEFTSGYNYQLFFPVWAERAEHFIYTEFISNITELWNEEEKQQTCVSVWVVSLTFCTVKKNKPTYISVVSTFKSNIRSSVCRWCCYISYNAIIFNTYIATLCFFYASHINVGSALLNYGYLCFN